MRKQAGNARNTKKIANHTKKCMLSNKIEKNLDLKIRTFQTIHNTVEMKLQKTQFNNERRIGKLGTECAISSYGRTIEI